LGFQEQAYQYGTLAITVPLLRQIGLKMTQQLAGRTAARWLPVVGALGVAAYAYRDTMRVGHTAIELFSGEVARADDPA
jgi:hypothetical protein